MATTYRIVSFALSANANYLTATGASRDADAALTFDTRSEAAAAADARGWIRGAYSVETIGSWARDTAEAISRHLAKVAG